MIVQPSCVTELIRLCKSSVVCALCASEGGIYLLFNLRGINPWLSDIRNAIRWLCRCRQPLHRRYRLRHWSLSRIWTAKSGDPSSPFHSKQGFPTSQPHNLSLYFQISLINHTVLLGDKGYYNTSLEVAYNYWIYNCEITICSPECEVANPSPIGETR